MQNDKTYHVVKRDHTTWAFQSVISGLGRNAGTLGAAHSKRTAQRHATRLNKSAPIGVVYCAEEALT